MTGRETLMNILYKNIIVNFSSLTSKTYEESLELLYKSKTFQEIKNGVCDIHCRSPYYLAQELMIELNLNNK